jgi:hypothetical protein
MLLRKQFVSAGLTIRYHVGRFSVRLCLQLFLGGPVSYLRYLCLFAHMCDQHMLCSIFVFKLLRLLCPVLPVSLDCPFFIVHSVFSDVYN